ncbi:hypothetical protein SY27_11685 [Flavobacterium sp. 316]|uniref:hypothetical protein n=1 Tax=Flavobacterium sp. 316 TaxID=1603293 RepID=UPI0005E3C50D|nr:hypothetical protein [Flavobacterium sp. 316]KIX20566.1 hypothetical protein SY27_11685 [Flavobacterium sp. 316]
MIFEGINIGFLWEDVNEKILDAPNPFDEKWRDAKIKYRDFNKTGSLEKMLQLLIIAYKDDSPRDIFTLSKDIKSAGNAIYKDNQVIQLKKDLARTDIEKFIDTIKDKDGLEIPVERFFEFVDSHNFTNMVENTLEGKQFSKTIEGNKIIFKVENSPIDSVELTSKSFLLKINDLIYKYKY